MKPKERTPRYQAGDRLPDDVICMSYDVLQLEAENERLKKRLSNAADDVMQSQDRLGRIKQLKAVSKRLTKAISKASGILDDGHGEYGVVARYEKEAQIILLDVLKATADELTDE